MWNSRARESSNRNNKEAAIPAASFCMLGQASDRLATSRRGQTRTPCVWCRYFPNPPGNDFASENQVFCSKNESSEPNGVTITSCARYELSAATRRKRSFTHPKQHPRPGKVGGEFVLLLSTFHLRRQRQQRRLQHQQQGRPCRQPDSRWSARSLRWMRHFPERSG